MDKTSFKTITKYFKLNKVRSSQRIEPVSFEIEGDYLLPCVCQSIDKSKRENLIGVPFRPAISHGVTLLEQTEGCSKLWLEPQFAKETRIEISLYVGLLVSEINRSEFLSVKRKN